MRESIDDAACDLGSACEGQVTAGEGNILARIKIARDASSGGHLRKISEQSTAQLLVSI
jgi:hypothetical protein